MQLRNPVLLAALAACYMQQVEEQPAGGNGQAQPTGSGGKVKKPSFCEKDWDDAFEGNGSVLYLNFANGKKLEFDLEKVNGETQRRLALHGASQKIGDSFAGVKGNFATGIGNAEKVISQLYAGEWEGEREGGGPRLAELSAAIARIKNVPVEKAAAAVEKASKEQRDGWRSNAQVKAMVAQIRAEKAAAALQESQKGGQSQEITVDLGE